MASLGEVPPPSTRRWPAASPGLDDPAYHDGLDAFDRDLADLAGPIWTSRYAGP